MRLLHVRGSVKTFAEEYNLRLSSNNILGVYVSANKTGYIFLDEIADEAKKQWLMAPHLRDEFKGRKGLQRFYLRIRRLVEYHEYAHHLQCDTMRKRVLIDDRLHNEHVADRYAQMRYLMDYRRPSRVSNSRRHLSAQEVLG